ncbi:eukaryotic translation initiation factor 4 gamma 2-like isoform X2 [Styela clava]
MRPTLMQAPFQHAIDNATQQGMQTTLKKLSDLESEIPLIKSSMGNFLSKVVIFELLALSDLGEMLVGGYHFCLFLLTLQQRSRVKIGSLVRLKKVRST